MTLDILLRETRKRWTGSRPEDSPAAAFLARQRRQHCGAGLVGRHSAERDAAWLTVAPEPEHPQPRPVRLAPQHESPQRRVADRVLAPAPLCREHESIAQADAATRFPDSGSANAPGGSRRNRLPEPPPDGPSGTGPPPRKCACRAAHRLSSTAAPTSIG